MLAVVLFRAGLGLPGRFLGVDVVVISCKVFALRLAEYADAGRSVDPGGLHRHRIRRLLPVMAAMTMAATAATVLLLNPHGPEQRAFHTEGAATMFMANGEISRSTGYSDS